MLDMKWQQVRVLVVCIPYMAAISVFTVLTLTLKFILRNFAAYIHACMRALFMNCKFFHKFFLSLISTTQKFDAISIGVAVLFNCVEVRTYIQYHNRIDAELVSSHAGLDIQRFLRHCIRIRSEPFCRTKVVANISTLFLN